MYVYDRIIKEFFANAFVEDDYLNCWVQRKEFVVSRESIQKLLEIRPMTLDSSLHFDQERKKEKKKKKEDKIESLVPILGG